MRGVMASSQKKLGNVVASDEALTTGLWIVDKVITLKISHTTQFLWGYFYLELLHGARPGD
jgi:hypothetical protein